MPAPLLTQEQAETNGLAADHPAQLLEPYKGDKVKHLYHFIQCRHEWEISPNNLHGGKGCGKCYGDQGSTYVYLMQRDDVLKVGITPVEPKKPSACRIYLHGKDGFTLLRKVEKATRAEAHAEEQAEIQRWRDDGIPPALEPGELKFGGEGETVSTEFVNVHEILKRLNAPVGNILRG